MARDRRVLQQLEREGGHYRMRWIRIRSLLLLDDGAAVVDVAKALGTYPRSHPARGWRYIDHGLAHALAEKVRAPYAN